jgi:hypothetical protein
MNLHHTKFKVMREKISAQDPEGEDFHSMEVPFKREGAIIIPNLFINIGDQTTVSL